MTTIVVAHSPQRSPLALLVLWQLIEAPMHVYRMHRLFLERGKDRVVNVRSRASLYQTIERLIRLGLVEVVEIVRGETHPDRVVYGITDTGREVARDWLRETLRSTGGEFPEFIAGVSILFGLKPEEAREQLELREQRLATELEETAAELEGAPTDLPRLFLLEEDYRRAILECELTWLRGVIKDLRTGRLTWSEEWLREVAQAFETQEDSG
jgi:DNA-binding PadR family transcriptional regulator